MSTKNERFNKLNNEGISTDKFFQIKVPDGLAPGSTISVVIDDNGNPSIQGHPYADAARARYFNDMQNIRDEIIKDGYVRNSKLHRRFIMAHMFMMLNYKTRDGRHLGYTEYLNTFYSYNYTISMMLEEIKVLAHLEKVDYNTFEERKIFFNKNVIVSTLEDYVKKLRWQIEQLPEKHCKGIPYKRIKGRDVFVDDIEKKIISPINDCIRKIRYNKTYANYYKYLLEFYHNDFIKLDYRTPKCHDWVDAYKGAGSYYTLKNMIMYHGCGIREYNVGCMFYKNDAMNILNKKVSQYYGEWWRLFAFMNKVIKDNNFDFDRRMREVYNDMNR